MQIRKQHIGEDKKRLSNYISIFSNVNDLRKMGGREGLIFAEYASTRYPYLPIGLS